MTIAAHFRFPIPVNGCLVKRAAEERRGEVQGTREVDEQLEVSVLWQGSSMPAWAPLRELRSGFRLGMEVLDVPRARARSSHGTGVVTETRMLGGREQHLVDFLETGHRVWAPYENLRFVRGVRHRFETAQASSEGGAERFRLRNLAYALENWHENTGALTHLSIDPLPHQIHLVHHILKSGNLNWLIADDVGLGKTIEVGMLLSALKSRGDYGRVLLVCPAGLVRQWKDEMHTKFALSDFQIYGEDFYINEIRDWKLHDHVIASLDLLKGKTHLETLMHAAPWDLVVFDEAHRLSRTQYGMKYDITDRFRLAHNLRSKTSAMLMLSATPHQGKQDKFQALLQLLRPEWHQQIDTLSLNPELLTRMVIRNNKADVTDASGNFIFKGKIVHSIDVDLGEEEKAFDRALRTYLEKGYAEASVRKDSMRRAIGFVMTVYRKLAASSVAAIEAALDRRWRLLRHERDAAAATVDTSIEDSPFETENEELFDGPADEFFSGEIALVEALLASARELRKNDRKIRAFVDGLVATVLKGDTTQKVLIFTEYRASQEYVAHELRSRFGPESVSLLHGSQDQSERSAAIGHFEADGQFLVSTEAGGEGINLQRACHVMVNFDLPWNPMRLVQRIGRLYRYGQTRQVVVFNMRAQQTLDAKIVQTMYDRIQQVVADMAPLGGDYRPGLEDDILGHVADLLDVEGILSAAGTLDIRRTDERIQEALQRARQAAGLQRTLFDYFAGYDASETKGELRLSAEHVRSFVIGMCAQLGIEITEQLHKGAILALKLPDRMRDQLGMRGSSLRVAFDRESFSSRADVQIMDFGSAFFLLLIAAAKDPDFDALTARLRGIDAEALIPAMLRWQNDQGRRMREEYCGVLVRADGSCLVNPDSYQQWLLHGAAEGSFVISRERARPLREAAEVYMDGRLASISNSDLHPENRQLVGAGSVQQDSQVEAAP